MHTITMRGYAIELDNEQPSIVTWYFNDGDSVDTQSVLCDVALAKAQFELVSKAKGRLRILVAAEVPFDEDTVIARIEPTT